MSVEGRGENKNRKKAKKKKKQEEKKKRGIGKGKKNVRSSRCRRFVTRFRAQNVKRTRETRINLSAAA